MSRPRRESERSVRSDAPRKDGNRRDGRPPSGKGKAKFDTKASGDSKVAERMKEGDGGSDPAIVTAGPSIKDAKASSQVPSSKKGVKPEQGEIQAEKATSPAKGQSLGSSSSTRGRSGIKTL